MEFSAKIVQLFDDAQIPSVLWVPLVMHLHGVPGEEFPRFVIPDHLIQPAYETLLAAGFPPCEEGENCIQCGHPRLLPIADKHIHISGQSFHAAVSLYKKSALLWTLPDFELGPPAADDRNLMLASDERLPPRTQNGGSGPWSSSLHPVKIPTAACYIEALMLLSCRDYHVGCNSYETHWQGNLYHMAMYVRNRWFKEEELLPHFLLYWRASSPNGRPELAELRKKLIERNELPPPPDYKSSN